MTIAKLSCETVSTFETVEAIRGGIATRVTQTGMRMQLRHREELSLAPESIDPRPCCETWFIEHNQ